MQEKDSVLRVVGRNKGGRSRYDEASKRALVEACLRPGVSVSGMALKAGVNANLLRKWIAQYLLERERSAATAVSSALAHEHGTSDQAVVQAIDVVAPTSSEASEDVPSAFVAVVQAPQATALAVAATSLQPVLSAMALALHVRLPNGVQFDLGEAKLEELSAVVQMLGRLPCSGSTTA